LTRFRRGLVFAASLTTLAAAVPARAEESDGVYGRFDGDFEIRAHAGAAFAAGGPALAASLSAIYFSTAGLYIHYTDALGSESPRVPRSIATGMHLSPLFVIRGAFNAERGPAFFDLFLDSLAVELGAVWCAPRTGPWDATPGLEAALSIGLPLAGRATGPWLGLRGAWRWRPADFAPEAPTNLADRGAVLSLTLGWHHILRAHIVDAGDRDVH
jgi:hypothetical protein